MATFTKINGFVEHLAEKVHNLASDELMIAFTNSDPTAALNASTAAAVLATVSEVSYTFASTRVVAQSSSAQTTGTYKLILDDLTVTASGGAIGPFRYVVLYNNTPTSPADPVIGVYDYGSSITVADGETFKFDASAVNGVLTVA